MTRAILFFILLSVFFVAVPVLAFSDEDSDSLIIKAVVPLTPEFSYLVSRHSTVEFNHTKITVSLKGNSSTLMIGHSVKMIIDSLTEIKTISNSNSQAFFNLNLDDLSIGEYKVSFIDTSYSPPIFLKKDMLLKVKPKEVGYQAVYYNFLRFISLSTKSDNYYSLTIDGQDI